MKTKHILIILAILAISFTAAYFIDLAILKNIN